MSLDFFAVFGPTTCEYCRTATDNRHTCPNCGAPKLTVRPVPQSYSQALVQAYNPHNVTRKQTFNYD